MSLQRLLLFANSLILASVLAVASLSALLKSAYDRMDAAQTRRVHSLMLADELRQSSDDLTRLARTYVETGEVRYQVMYAQVLAIRDGQLARPQNYERVYWDLVSDPAHLPRPGTQAVSLQSLMQQAAFSDAELAKLAEAERNSNALVATERKAMSLASGLYPDAQGRPTVAGPRDPVQARRLMNDDAYHRNKAAIMAPIGEFQQLLDTRTRHETTQSLRVTNRLFWSLQAVLLVIGCAVLMLFRLKRRQAQLQVVNTQLRLARDAAEAATQQKNAFLANMSHEIRTPMNAVIGMTHLALQTELTPQQRQYLEKSRLAADGLLGVINDILDFSKIEAGKLQMDVKEFPLEDVYNRVTHLVGARASEKRLEFMLNVAPDVPTRLVGDALRLGQVLTNLCSNAVKFTDAGEVIVAFRRLDEAAADRVKLEFSVRDTGIGMSAGQVEALFKPFSQVDSSSTRRFGGTGLGLAISQHLVQMMGGRIWVDSAPGEGSTFYFTASFGLPASASGTPAVAAPLHPLNVLVVDDSTHAGEIISGMVAALGHRVDAEESAAAALQRLRQAAYDLVFLDWQMPQMDGFEAAEAIRGNPVLPQQPRIVLVTAYGDEAMAERARRQGLDGYLAKPVTPSSLLDAMTKACGSGPARIKSAPHAPARLAAADAARLRGARVLVVEDNDFNQQVAAELLGMVGVEVTLVDNGQAALDTLRERRFDAVLMDLQMPVMDGYEATRRLRANPDYNQLPVLAMTAHAMTQERERCRALGMNDYITKPIDPYLMYATLARWLPSDGSVPAAPQAQPEPTPPATDTGAGAIDWSQGLSYCSGSAELYDQALRRFVQSAPVTLAKLREALGRRDTDAAARQAHSMVSVAAFVGARSLSASAQALQQAIVADGTDTAHALFERFNSAAIEVLHAVQQRLGEPPPH